VYLSFSLFVCFSPSFPPHTHTHTRTHTHTHARARAHARTHARTHTLSCATFLSRVLSLSWPRPRPFLLRPWVAETRRSGSPAVIFPREKRRCVTRRAIAFSRRPLIVGRLEFSQFDARSSEQSIANRTCRLAMYACVRVPTFSLSLSLSLFFRTICTRETRASERVV